MNEEIAILNKYVSPRKAHRRTLLVLFGLTYKASEHEGPLSARIRESVQEFADFECTTEVWTIGDGALLVRTIEKMKPDELYMQVESAIPQACWEYLAVFKASRAMYNGESSVDKVMMGTGLYCDGWLEDELEEDELRELLPKQPEESPAPPLPLEDWQNPVIFVEL